MTGAAPNYCSPRQALPVDFAHHVYVVDVSRLREVDQLSAITRHIKDPTELHAAQRRELETA